MKSGIFIDSGRGFKCFEPIALQYIERKLEIAPLYRLLERANMALGELRALDDLLPNPKLITGRYMEKEAVLSSQIEGTQSTLSDIIENKNITENSDTDIKEVTNYLDALNYGIKKITKENFPISNRLLKECHEILMTGVRGGEPSKTPGEFRRTQNFIGGSSPSNAFYVPPSEENVLDLMSGLEKYIHYGELPDLIKIALIHYQFETIHPFLDGNGRIGRLIITLYLINQDILKSPTLYLSLYLKTRQIDYYDHLTNVRLNGGYDKWIKFFLEGIIKVSNQVMMTTRKILDLKENDKQKIKTENEYILLDFLFIKPIVNIKQIETHLDVSNKTANTLATKFEKKGILKQANSKQRNKKYVYSGYMSIIEAGL